MCEPIPNPILFSSQESLIIIFVVLMSLIPRNMGYRKVILSFGISLTYFRNILDCFFINSGNLSNLTETFYFMIPKLKKFKINIKFIVLTFFKWK
jgi:hypothetical protein